MAQSSKTTTQLHWEHQILDKRKRQTESIPQDWLIPDINESKQSNVLGIPASCGLLSQRELEITDTTDVNVLLTKLAHAEWSSVEVTTAFCKRAVIAHQLTNCLTEIFIDKALQRATELDDHLAKTGTVVGPLHGLPVSLKDQFGVKGLESTMGYAAWIGKIVEEDAVLVNQLVQAGAVLYVKTNVPQTLMWTETNNNVFGRTLNPYNIHLTPGGSTGGEGALLAMRGSILGVGTDIGGSIRVPSHFCGLYGLKSTSNRVPSYGIVNSLDGQEAISTICGPMSPSLSGIKLFMKTILTPSPSQGALPAWRLDPNTIKKPWDENAYLLKEYFDGGRVDGSSSAATGGETRKLCFGVMWDDEIFKPHPPVRRALEMVKKSLEDAGHSVIEWYPYKHRQLVANTRSIYLADGGLDFQASLITGEPLINSMKPGADPNDIAPHRLTRPPLDSYQLWQLHIQRRGLRKEYFEKWEETVGRTGTGRPLDAIFCPVAPYAAVPHGEKRGAAYTMAWNSLDCPVLVIPVTKVDPSVDLPAQPHEFRSNEDKAVYEMYDPAVFQGAPVGIQLVAQRYEEEALIGMGEIVEKALQSAFHNSLTAKPSRL